MRVTGCNRKLLFFFGLMVFLTMFVASTSAIPGRGGPGKRNEMIMNEEDENEGDIGTWGGRLACFCACLVWGRPTCGPSGCWLAGQAVGWGGEP